MSIGRAVEAQAPSPQRLIAHHVLGRWIGATVVAEAIGFAAAMAIGRGVYAAIGGEPTGLAGEALTIGLSLLVGAVEGACLGTGQWRVLRRVLPEVRAGVWILATATGGALAWVLGMSAGPRLHPVSPGGTALVLVASGLLLGGVLGGAQALALRHRRRLACAWVLASAIGWMLGLLFAYAGVAALPDEGLTPSALILLGVAGAAMAVLPALATGLVLRRARNRRCKPCRARPRRRVDRMMTYVVSATGRGDPRCTARASGPGDRAGVAASGRPWRPVRNGARRARGPR